MGIEPNTKIILDFATGGHAIQKTYDELFLLLNHILQGSPKCTKDF